HPLPAGIRGIEHLIPKFQAGPELGQQVEQGKEQDQADSGHGKPPAERCQSGMFLFHGRSSSSFWTYLGSFSTTSRWESAHKSRSTWSGSSPSSSTAIQVRLSQ